MSYILDALKKMEHEKTRKAGPAGMTKISGDLFREGRSRPPQSGMWKLIAVAVVASVVAGATTWFFLAPSLKAAHVASHESGLPERMMAPSPVLPAAPPVMPRAPVSPAAQPAQPLPQPASPPVLPQEAQSQPSSQDSQLSVARSSATPSHEEPDSRRKNRKRSPMPSVADQSASVMMAAPPADIKVAGIAWQEERKARRAVVNGFLLKEGSVVSGARISEIRKDRVRFSQAGRNFEVTMTAPGGSAPAPGSASNPGAPPSR